MLLGFIMKKKLWREKGRIKRVKSLSKKKSIHATEKTFRNLKQEKNKNQFD
jgi:hypothetical protein